MIPQKVAVLNPVVTGRVAQFRGTVVHVAFDEQHLAWGWYLPDDTAAPRTLHAYQEGACPMGGDTYVRSVTDHTLLLLPPAQLQLAMSTFHVYSRLVPKEVPS